MFHLFISALILSLGFSTSGVYASQSCSAAFSGGIANSSNDGSINFSDWGTLYGSTNNVLNTTTLNNYSWYNNSCSSADCSASGNIVPELQAQYQRFSSTEDVYLYNNNRTLSGNNYDYITVDRYSQLNFSGNHSSYHFRQLWIDRYSVVNLPAGDYYIDHLVIQSGGRLNVSGNGTVRIYTKNQMVFGYDAVINDGASGSPEKLFLYHFGEQSTSLSIYSGAKVSALIYSDEDIYIGGWFPSPWKTQVYGAIAARDDIYIAGTAEVHYSSSAVTAADYGGNCQVNQPEVLHHVVISHDGAASSCAAESVTIKACSDAACSQTYSSEISLDFTVGGSVKKSVTFTGQTSLDFTHTVAETTNLGITNLSVTPSAAFSCTILFGASCQMVFSDSGCSNGNSCAATFPDGASNSSNNGYIYFHNSGYVQGSPDNILDTRDLYHSGNNYPSCQSGYCSKSNDVVPAFVEQVLTTNSNSVYSVSSSGSSVISNSEYKRVSVTGGHTLTMNSQHNTYRFNRLSIGNNSTVYLTPGDYHIRNLYIDGGFLKVHSSVSGTVRIFVSNEFQIYGGARVNDDVFGDPNKLYFYHHGRGNTQIYISNAEVSGYFYSHKHITVTDRAVVYGAVTGKSSVTISYAGHVNYKPPTSLVLDGVCGAPVASVNHYRLEYDGSGLTCQTQGVTLKACQDASCSSLMDTPTTVQLSVASSTQATSDITFTGSTQVTIAETLPTSVTLGLNSSTPSASYQCYQSGELDASCDYQLSDTGFIFVNENEVDPVRRLQFPTQIAGKPSDIGYNRVSMSLQAVQTDTNTGSCTALFAQSADVSVNMAYSCVDPVQCSANVAVLGNNGNNTSLTQLGQYTPMTLRFGADSKANLNLTYPDVGKIKLHAQKSVVLNPSVGNSTTKVLTGSSEDITVRPFALRIAVAGNGGGSDASGTVLTKAGEGFDTTISAVQWVTGQDSDGDGVPDSGDNISTNPVTPNFGQEATKESVSLTSAIVSPAGGYDPGIVNGSFNTFLNGFQVKSGSSAPSWAEVGVINLSATTDNSYLDTNESVSGYLANVGRFVPHHFNVTNSALVQGCSAFSYMGQTEHLALTVEAQNKANGVLVNYDSGVGNDFHGQASIGLVAENSNNGVDLTGRLTQLTTQWIDGRFAGTFDFSFNRLTAAVNNIWMDGPYESLQVALKLNDGIVGTDVSLSNALDVNSADTGSCSSKGNCDALAIGSANAYRYGRVKMSAAFGPNAGALQLPIETEYWNGSEFVLSTQDSCSRLVPRDFTISGVNDGTFDGSFDVSDMTSNSAVGSSSVDLTQPNTTAIQLSSANGEFDLTFNPPNYSTQGSISGYIAVSLDVSNYPWLQFDWDGNGSNAIDNNDKILPSQRVTFGQYRGNDRVIYWREKR